MVVYEWSSPTAASGRQRLTFALRRFDRTTVRSNSLDQVVRPPGPERFRDVRHTFVNDESLKWGALYAIVEIVEPQLFAAPDRAGGAE